VPRQPVVAGPFDCTSGMTVALTQGPASAGHSWHAKYSPFRLNTLSDLAGRFHIDDLDPMARRDFDGAATSLALHGQHVQTPCVFEIPWPSDLQSVRT